MCVKKEAVFGIVAILFILGFFVFNNRDDFDSGDIDEKRDLNILDRGIGELCKTISECEKYCSSNSFTCEAYCLQNQDISFCAERFSYLSSGNFGESKMRFPEFRNYRYVFENGRLVEKKPEIQNIGIEIDFYNPSTKKAGDFKFDEFKYEWGEVYSTKIFGDFGELEGNQSNAERSPQLVYVAPLGTKVRAIASGIVTHIGDVYSGDYTVFVINPESPSIAYEHEHVINVIVEEGDYVVAGQPIAEVSNYNKWYKEDGYGVVDIGLFREVGENPGHLCPINYLNDSLKDDYFAKIRAFYTSWEDYMDDESLYDESNYVVPGCIVVDVL